MIHTLTRALQHELGLTMLSDNFGPATLSTLSEKFPKIDDSTALSATFYRIIQAALYCKGYDGGQLDGTYNERVQRAVSQLKKHMGVSSLLPSDALEPKIIKALLSMDAYTIVGQGTEDVREIQQWINGRYINRRDFFIIPCDGNHSRDVAKSMLLAIQYELGMPDGVANGAFGDGTKAGLRSHIVAVGDSSVWARIFTAAMVLNRRPVSFGNFTTDVAAATRDFQSFALLPETGLGDFATWSSLLVSHGDQTRPGSACDGVTKITPERAKALFDAGYRYVGRYLTVARGFNNLPEKAIQPGELENIRNFGLRCFPIYQTVSRSADYFSQEHGAADAYIAIDWANLHGFRAGTIIYFAVDYDAMDQEVSEYIIPHFRSVCAVLHENSEYRVGVYGPRNICQRVFDAGLSVTSFVSDMSSGFSGNLGYALPTNWAFDQIQTTAVGSDSSYIEIDKDVASGRDIGQNEFDIVPRPAGLDVDFNEAKYGAALRTDVHHYMESIGVPETGGDEWKNDKDWVTLGGISTSRALDLVLGGDWIFTSLARKLHLRKALIQAPVIWELRHLNPLDVLADEAVKNGIKDDCSTGWGQVFATVAIQARNFCIDSSIINGPKLDLQRDLHSVWEKLNKDPVYNIQSAAYLTIFNGFQLDRESGTQIGRPGLDTGHEDIQRLLARYNGTGPKAEEFGKQLIGLYDILESYNELARHDAS